MLPPGWVTQPDLYLPRRPRPEMGKREAPSDPELMALLAPANLETLLPQVMLQANLLAKAIQLLPEMVRRERANPRLPATLQENSLVKATQPFLEMVRPVPANRPLAEEDLDLLRTERRWVRVRPLAARVKLRDLRRRRAERFPFPPGRERQCLQCPGPCAFFREIPAAQKCNRAARYDALPICARYRHPRNRRALAGCDNKCSRSQRKHARRARPFPIAALDKCPCLPRRTAD